MTTARVPLVLSLLLSTVIAVAATTVTPPGTAAAPKIPLIEGLTIVSAYRSTDGDYEGIRTVTHADAAEIHVKLTTDEPPYKKNSPMAALLDDNCPADDGEMDDRKKTWSVVRVISRADLENGREYRQDFHLCGDGQESFPGSTAISLSASALRELNEKGSTPLRVAVSKNGNPLNAMIAGLLSGPSAEELDSVVPGLLRRVEPNTVPVKVLINDEPRSLDAVHARGDFGKQQIEFWVSIDPTNPLVLRTTWPGGGMLQMIRIAFPKPRTPTAPPARAGMQAPAEAQTQIETDLANQGRAIVYGIFFDFRSDHIKPESEPVLREIATALRHNPDWSLQLDGHTDSIGGDVYNLDLSKRRSAAVKSALVGRYGIEAKRLQTNGYGASQPKEANDTIEGRARNRRVELLKINS